MCHTQSLGSVTINNHHPQPFRVLPLKSSSLDQYFLCTNNSLLNRFTSLAIISAYVMKYVIRNGVSFSNPIKDVISVCEFEVNLKNIASGRAERASWPNKEVFTWQRAAKQIARMPTVDMHLLPDPDPELDTDRVKKSEWLIVIGEYNTPSRCIMLPYDGMYGGFLCYYHGVHYDVSGRIRRGSVRTNLEVPDYVFIDDNTVVIGRKKNPIKF
ncbi:unnamed protein product [Rotaria socialis]|uniref:Uncharacterized protein n=2 Tax=Rotaria socialis TaxID=392032 RepID=A0A821N2Z2_9BILA|nr:unnamed protein product [Rotaria socialis]